MYEHVFEFFGLRENPFHVSPDPRFFVPASVHRSALAELTMGVDTHQGFIVLTGEAGTGKTILLQHLLTWLQDRRQSSCYISQSQLRPLELFEAILDDFGVSCESKRKGDLLAALKQWLSRRHAMGDSPVLIIDEAQAMSLRTLDRLRLLLNLEIPGKKLLQIVLAGQPELELKLRRPELRHLDQRIMFRCILTPLLAEETADYVKSRMANGGAKATDAFPDETLEAVHMYSQGIPRVVNLLCEHALIGGFAEKRKVITPEMVERVATTFELTWRPTSPSKKEHVPHFPRLVAARTDEKTTLIRPEIAVAAEQKKADKQPPPAKVAVHETKPEKRPEPVPPLIVQKPIYLAAAAGSTAAVGTPKPQVVPAPITVRTKPKLQESEPPKQVAPKELSVSRNRGSMGGRFVGYWRGVGQSFASDWKNLLRTQTTAKKASRPAPPKA